MSDCRTDTADIHQHLCDAEKDNESAIASFRQAVELDPDYLLAKVYLALGQVLSYDYHRAPEHLWEAAFAAGHAAVEADGEDGHCHWLLGVMYGTYGNTEREARHYPRAVELNPNDANAVVCTGAALAIQGSQTKASSASARRCG